jgi:hypothetical protein
MYLILLIFGFLDTMNILVVGMYMMDPDHLLAMYENVPENRRRYFSALLFSNPCWKLKDAPKVKATQTKDDIDLDNVSAVFTIEKKKLNFPSENEIAILPLMHQFVIEKQLNIQPDINPTLNPHETGMKLITNIK